MTRRTFTISTQTYNRKHRLPRVYESLRAQTFQDFEWIIVDDGSTDGTEGLVKIWQQEARFPIRYLYQQNRGKHVGFNRAVKEAQGELLLSFDSDDSCVANALERFKYHWDSIPDKENYSTLSVLCMDDRGNLVGTKYPRDVVDAASFREQFQLRSAERWGINRTDVLKEYPFPEIAGERFVPEALIWNRLALKFKARFVNEMLRIYHSEPGGLASSLDKIRVESPNSATLYYLELSRMPIPAAEKARAVINYVRFSLHARRRLAAILGEGCNPLLTASLFPAGVSAYQRDLYRLRRQDAACVAAPVTAGIN